MEKDITDLVERMSNILSFVEDTDIICDLLDDEFSFFSDLEWTSVPESETLPYWVPKFPDCIRIKNVSKPEGVFGGYIPLSNSITERDMRQMVISLSISVPTYYDNLEVDFPG